MEGSKVLVLQWNTCVPPHGHCPGLVVVGVVHDDGDRVLLHQPLDPSVKFVRARSSDPFRAFP